MLQRHILYVAKTKFTCCKDKSTVLGVSVPAGAFVSVNKGNLIVENTTQLFFSAVNLQYMIFLHSQDTTPLKNTVLGMSAPRRASFSP